MTGAMLAEGADGVVPYEEAEAVDGGVNVTEAAGGFAPATRSTGAAATTGRAT